MMEALLPYYLVPLLLIPLSLYLVSFLRHRSCDNLPPGTTGWPILGENMAIAFWGLEKFIKRRMHKHSPEVFRTSMLGEKMAVFCGAQGNKFLFTNENKLVSTWLPESVTKTLFPGERNITEVLSLAKALLNDINLKPDGLRKYVPVMDSMARDQMVRHWVPDSAVKVFPLSKKYAFELGCKIFIGVVDPERVKKLWDPFALLTYGMLSVPIDLPGTAYNGAVRGGRLVREELVRVVRERRKEVVEEGEMVAGRRHHDFLSKMLLVRDGDGGGETLSDVVICNYVMGLFVASFETISSTITGVLNYLAQLPHIYTHVLREQMEIAKSKGPDELLTWEDIEKMKYSWNVVREAMRLTPPTQGTFRQAITEFRYAGFTIPKGWKTFWTVHSTHKNPEYFLEPDKFDPSRFEGKGPAPYTFVPFGGGPHMCPGRGYAKMEILVFVHNVVTRFRLEKVNPNEKIVFRSAPTPTHGLPLHLHPHKK